MTYNVFGANLNFTQLQLHSQCVAEVFRLLMVKGCS